MKDIIPVIIIGGGQAGISLSYYLQQRQIEYLILEKDRAFSSWHQRWDSFKLNTANWMNTLPGLQQVFVDGAGDYELATKQQALHYFEKYFNFVKPLIQYQTVISAHQESERLWIVKTDKDTYRCRNLVSCIGSSHRAKFPAIKNKIPNWVDQLHSQDYRRPNQIKTSRVLVVGSGSSGMQIAYDLFLYNKFAEIFVSMGSSAHFPWKLFGLPIHFWAKLLGIFDINRNSFLGKKLFLRAKSRGDPAAPPSPALLASLDNVTLYSKLIDLQQQGLIFKKSEYLSLDDLSIIWCTGFQYDFSFIKSAQSFRDNGEPTHTRGVSNDLPGLFFLGLRFQYTLGSHILYGIGTDAAYVSNQIENRLLANM